MWACLGRFKMLIYFFTKLSMDLYCPKTSKHTELCFILFHANTQNNNFKMYNYLFFLILKKIYNWYPKLCEHTKPYVYTIVRQPFLYNYLFLLDNASYMEIN